MIFRKILRSLFWILLPFLLWFVVHVVVMLSVAFGGELERADAALILGSKVELSGVPSERLQWRLDEGLRVYEEGLVDVVVVSGGVGKEGFDEAEVMANYLVEKGVRREMILVDSEGNNSYLTARNFVEIAEEEGLESVIVVSDYYHLWRVELALGKFDFDDVQVSSGTEVFSLRDFYAIPREFLAYYVYLARY